MIKLFQNIRKNLLAEGKTTRYIKYAIGEIILVVIENNNLNLKTHPYCSPSGRGQGWVSTMRKIKTYNPSLVPFTKKLHNNMTLGEIAMWREIKNKKLGVSFNRQIPIDNYIVDFLL